MVAHTQSFGVRINRQGYEAASKNFIPDDLDGADLKGKIAMVTGSNSGIGLATATALADLGAEVHLVCRNPDRAEAARKEIVEKTGNEVSQGKNSYKFQISRCNLDEVVKNLLYLMF